MAQYASLGAHYRARHDRQWMEPCSANLSPSLPEARSQTHQDQALYPRTNGKAERFIQTSLREWAYAQAYKQFDERTAKLPRWLHRYNWHRPHSSIGAKPPVSVSIWPRTTSEAPQLVRRSGLEWATWAPFASAHGRSLILRRAARLDRFWLCCG